MTGRSLVDAVTLVELCASLAACLVFITMFHTITRSSWRRTAMGRHFMVLMTVLAVIMTLSIAQMIFGDYPLRRIVLTVLFGIFTAVLWGQVWLLRQIHRDYSGVARVREPDDEGGDQDDPRT